MERLTRRINGRSAVIDGYALDTIKGAKAVVDRLAAYEDTGLEPGEIESILDKYGRGFTAKTAFMDELQAYRTKIPFDRLDEAAALVKAQDEGREAVLREEGQDKPSCHTCGHDCAGIEDGPCRDYAPSAAQDKTTL